MLSECSDRAQVVNVLDLYAGAGGTSYIDQESDRVIIQTKWAIDFSASACATFAANFPGAQVCAIRMQAHCAARLELALLPYAVAAPYQAHKML